MPDAIVNTVHIDAPAADVWRALTDVDEMPLWLGEPSMQVAVTTTWQVGAPILLTGRHHGPFVADGVVEAFEPERLLRHTQRSSVSRLPAEPSSYSTLTFELTPSSPLSSSLTIRVTGFPTEVIYKHLAFYWAGTMQIIKKHVEAKRASSS